MKYYKIPALQILIQFIYEMVYKNLLITVPINVADVFFSGMQAAFYHVIEASSTKDENWKDE